MKEGKREGEKEKGGKGERVGRRKEGSEGGKEEGM
jgi:hypothetical protein